MRSTTKYWVRNEDVSTVKHHVLQHLPVFQFDKVGRLCGCLIELLAATVGSSFIPSWPVHGTLPTCQLLTCKCCSPMPAKGSTLGTQNELGQCRTAPHMSQPTSVHLCCLPTRTMCYWHALCCVLQDNFAGDAQLINSVYLDNSSCELYHGRLDKKPGAIALRVRWCATLGLFSSVRVPVVSGSACLFYC